MPRLLLVDDNPSIHKIAETLLAPTSIELVCVESGPEAIARIEAGEAFEVALVDAAMAGMDGWELLDWLRKNPSTAGIPIALMAGVLDSVDPLRLEQAPIQGFLKKPVELRDLGDRVKRLLETPVPPPPPPPAPEVPVGTAGLSPFATLPAVKLKDLPEFRTHLNPLAAEVPTVAPDLDESDLLELGEEDLLPEAAPSNVVAEPVVEELDLEVPEVEESPLEEEPLDLEELDLDGLKGLNLEAASASPEAPVFVEPVSPDPEPSVTGDLSDAFLDSGDALTVSPEDLPDLGEAESLAPVAGSQPPPLPEPSLDFDWADDSESLLGPSDLASEPEALAQVPEPVEAEPLPVPEVALPAPSAPTLNLEAPLAPVESSSPSTASAAVGADPVALIEALKADPVAMRMLAKALVAELGEDTLKEIAWELMPELAERLTRH